LENENNIESKYEEEGKVEQQGKSQEAEEIEEQRVNSFWDIYFGLGEEEEYVEEINMSQNAVTIRS
jgi:hypothetical protein